MTTIGHRRLRLDDLHLRLDDLEAELRRLKEIERRRREQAGHQHEGDHDPGTTRWQHNTLPSYNPQ